jgi:uncharacterized protein (DUF885 family)
VTVRILVLSTLALLTLPAQERDASQAFQSLIDREWEYRLERSPEFASYLGDRRYNDRWSDESLAAQQAEKEHARQVLADLAAIDRAKLKPAEQINYDLFKKRAEENLRFREFNLQLMPVDQMNGLQDLDDLSNRVPLETVKDYEDWITRMRRLPELINQTTTLMREGMKQKLMHPKIILQGVPAQLAVQLESDPKKHPFYKPLTRIPASISAADRQRLEEQAQAAITNQVVPAYRKFHEFFTKEYLPASYDQVGIWQVPNGEKIYSFSAERYTTTSYTPQQIHEIGLAEVKRIRAEMETIKVKTGFQGTLKDFFKYLRTDPKFFYRSGPELLDAYRAMAKSIDPHLTKIFRTLPRTPYGVIPVPDAMAPTQTTAYYWPPSADGKRPGYYYVNLYQPESRPKWEMLALSLHEAVPGHHLQIALAQEQRELPNFRRYSNFTAFTEGWGLYAESLGEDMGLYAADPYSKFGQLTYEMWRAVRLVVDTGMHSMKWDRQKAIDFFLENAPKTELDVTNEINRYIAWPGQALAYKSGELKIKELRARSQKQLGTNFDLREFHDVVLRNGALPLDVLEAQVDQWLASKR